MLGRLIVWGGLAVLLAVALVRSRQAIRNALGTQGRILRRGGRRLETAGTGAPPGTVRIGKVMETAGSRLERLGT